MDGRRAGGLHHAPWHNKSLIEEVNGRKDVYFDMRKRWRKTKPLLPDRRAPARRALAAR